MISSFDNGPTPDDRPRPSGAPRPRRPLRRRTARVLRWWLGLGALAFIACMLCVLAGFGQADFAPLHIVITGDELDGGITIDGPIKLGQAVLALGVLMLIALALLLIPVVLALAIGAVALALVCAVAVPLVVLALVLGVATSPLWLVALLIWSIVRRRPSAPRPGSARMAA